MGPIKRILQKKELIHFPKRLQYKKRPTGLLGTSKEIKHVNPKTAIAIYKTIVHNLENLSNKKKVICKKSGAVILKEHNGSHPGKNNQGVYSVTTNNKKFFVKFSTPTMLEFNMIGIKKAANIIRKNFKSPTHSVKVITPHIIYSTKKRGILVSNYINLHEAVSLYDALVNKNPPIPKQAINNFNRAQKILHLENTSDVYSHNAFYHFKTKNILLFDINGYE